MISYIVGAGEQVFGSSDFTEKIVWILDLANILQYSGLRIYFIVQRIGDLSNIFAQIVDLACNLIRILDCDFIDKTDKTIVGSADFASNLGGSANLYIPIPPSPPPHYLCREKMCLSESILQSMITVVLYNYKSVKFKTVKLFLVTSPYQINQPCSSSLL